MAGFSMIFSANFDHVTHLWGKLSLAERCIGGPGQAACKMQRVGGEGKRNSYRHMDFQVSLSQPISRP